MREMRATKVEAGRAAAASSSAASRSEAPAAATGAAARVAMVERLDARTCLSSVTARLDGGGTLHVTGTDAADVVALRRAGDELRVYVDGSRYRTVAYDAVRRVRATLGKGQDALDLSRAYVRADRADAGPHNDTVVGSTRDDSIRGSSGDDLLAGGEGDDTLRGEDGRDEVRGGPGDDHVDGGHHSDDLFGDEGDDFLDADDKEWEDDVDGGPGDDEAQADRWRASVSWSWDGLWVDAGDDVIDDVERVEDVDWKP